MTTDFERQLEQMLPAVLDTTKPKQRTFAKIALGFVLGVIATYVFMQSGDTPRQADWQARYTLAFDDTKLHEVRQPADMFRLVVRVPIQQPVIDQTQWQYGTLRNNLLQL